MIDLPVYNFRWTMLALIGGNLVGAYLYETFVIWSAMNSQRKILEEGYVKTVKEEARLGKILHAIQTRGHEVTSLRNGSIQHQQGALEYKR